VIKKYIFLQKNNSFSY